MMWTTIEKIMAFAGLFLLVETSLASGQIYQWTDIKGVIHFTDNLASVPESIRNSSTLIVRKDMVSDSHPSVTAIAPPPAAEISAAKNSLDAEREPLATTVVNYAPQEVNVVVVNSDSRQPNLHPCAFGGHCKPAFRPDFTDRRYIHPSVFDGSSRRYGRR